MGPAGSGKTYKLINEIKKYHKPLVLAPTHKALSVIKSRIGNVGSNIQYQTLHSALNYKPKLVNKKLTFTPTGGYLKKFKRYDMIFIDEASMVSEEMFQSLMAVKNIHYFGDPYQLPAVGDKSPAIITYQNTFDYVEILKDIHRVKDPFLQQIALHPTKTFNVLKKGLDNGSVKIANMSEYTHEDSVILAYRNNTVDSYNEKVRKYLGYKSEYEIGEKLIAVNKNIYMPINEMIEIKSIELKTIKDFKENSKPVELKYYLINKTIKVLAKESQQDFLSVLNFWRRLSEKEYLRLSSHYVKFKPAYALTVHRSQGSQWKNVYVDIKDIITADKNIRNNLIYVAVTRMEKKLYLIN